MKVITLEKTVDCFGFSDKYANKCSALETKSMCPMLFGGKCGFHKTNAQFYADKNKVVLWFSQLQVEKRKKIILKYGSEFFR